MGEELTRSAGARRLSTVEVPGTPRVIGAGPVFPAEATTTMPASQAAIRAWLIGSSQ
jgi:hypothetical protein